MIELRNGLRAQIRHATVKDMNYLHSAIATSYKFTSRDALQPLEPADRERYMRTRLGQSMDVFLVATPPESPEYIMGFVWGIGRFAVLHYVYVNELYRKQGLALALVAALFKGSPQSVLCTTWTRDFAERFGDAHLSTYWRLL